MKAYKFNTADVTVKMNGRSNNYVEVIIAKDDHRRFFLDQLEVLGMDERKSSWMGEYLAYRFKPKYFDMNFTAVKKSHRSDRG